MEIHHVVARGHTWYMCIARVQSQEWPSDPAGPHRHPPARERWGGGASLHVRVGVPCGAGGREASRIDVDVGEGASSRAPTALGGADDEVDGLAAVAVGSGARAASGAGVRAVGGVSGGASGDHFSTSGEVGRDLPPVSSVSDRGAFLRRPAFPPVSCLRLLVGPPVRLCFFLRRL